MNDARPSSKSGASAAHWNSLLGVWVEVTLEGRTIARGVVEEVSPDNEYVWLAGNGIDTRRLIHRAEGYVLIAEAARAITGTKSAGLKGTA